MLFLFNIPVCRANYGAQISPRIIPSLISVVGSKDTLSPCLYVTMYFIAHSGFSERVRQQSSSRVKLTYTYLRKRYSSDSVIACQGQTYYVAGNVFRSFCFGMCKKKQKHIHLNIYIDTLRKCRASVYHTCQPVA